MSSLAGGDLLTATGMAILDAGLQYAQMGSLSDPFSVPTQEAYYITLQAWAVDPNTGNREIPLMTHTFSVMPNSMQILKTYLSGVVSTPGGVYVDDFVLPDSSVVVPYSTVISGNFGKKARLFLTGENLVSFDGGLGQLMATVGNLFGNISSNSFGADLVTGYGQTKFLDRLCDLSHTSLTSPHILQALNSVQRPSTTLSALNRLANQSAATSSADGTSYATADIPVEVILYNWAFHQFVVILINQVQFSRSANLNCWTYSLRITALRDATQSPEDLMSNLLKSTVQKIANIALDTVIGVVNMPLSSGPSGSTRSGEYR